MGSIRINQVSYFGNNYSYISPIFDKSISIIEGPNGTGKSTLFNLINFALGGKVEEFEKGNDEQHKEIVYDSNNYVELSITLTKNQFTLIRDFKENKIQVLSDKEFLINGDIYPKAALLPINRNNSDTFTFSDWLLESLDIPVMELFSSGKSFKLNFSDLSRLIYHSQLPDRTGIYKQNEKNSYVSDSLQVRNAIFEILVGKNLRDLYIAIGNLKKKQSEYDSKRSILNEYKSIVNEILAQYGFKEIINEFHLKDKIAENKKEIERLNNFKKDLYSSAVRVSPSIELIDKEKRSFVTLDKKMMLVKVKKNELFKEKLDLKNVYDKSIQDISRIEKILHTHKQLNLFSSDTCPYCLTTVHRLKNKCICGSDIEEGQYQRYFYEPTEYYALLSSKIKSLETVKLAIEAVDEDIKENTSEINGIQENLNIIEKKISHRVGNIEEISQHEVIEDLDENIFSIKSLNNDLEQALKMEIKLSRHQNSLSVAKIALDKAKIHEGKMQAVAANELLERVSEFNKIYCDYMVNCLTGCRIAEIDSGNYIPSVNDGEYKEASAKVPKRFFYYLTLLKLSLEKDIPFPKFLLIDTPENHGIDKDNLNKMLDTIRLLKHEGDYQILLSTGEGKYPESLADNVVIRLSEDDRLLKKVN
jgi:energy-coupling factor transporter ATP-binding protein EcfA2